MRLSVVIPAHDAEATIGSAIRSALAQTRAPGEVVVVDDGSADDTVGVVARFGDAVRVLRQPQSGPSAARNTGVAAASGDWVAFLDADDQWHPAKLEHQCALATEADTVLVATDWARELPTGPLPAVLPQSTVGTDALLLLNRFQTSTVLLRRDAFMTLGGFDTTLDGVEDWDLWLRASRVGTVVKLDWPLVRYRDTASGYSKQLRRVYETGTVLLEQRLAEQPVDDSRTLMAWHHLRFAVAFLLDGDRADARACIRRLRTAHLVGAAPTATVRYLLPFLARRVIRRLPRRAG